MAAGAGGGTAAGEDCTVTAINTMLASVAAALKAPRLFNTGMTSSTIRE
jgi:hypothetical protein